MNPSTQQLTSFGRRLAVLAKEHPCQSAIVAISRSGFERRMSWRELEAASNRAARLLAQTGAAEGSTVVVGVPNCLEHFVATFAAWKLGATPVPLYPGFPDRERDALLDLISHPGFALASGGSTGRPKLIVSPNHAARVPDVPVAWMRALGFGPRQTQLVAVPLYHAAGFILSYHGLFDDNTLVLMEKFDAALAVGLVERHRVDSAFLPPI